MKWSRCVLVAVIALAEACARPVVRSSPPADRVRFPEYVRVGTKDGNRLTIRQVPFELYVQATILSEFAPPSGDAATVERMLEVQSIIARTYALSRLGRHSAEGYDLCSTTHCQLYDPARLRTSRWAPLAAEAVRQTAGHVLWFDGAPASVVFHADCGGHTSRADDVWSGSGRPYLVSILDDGPAEHAHSTWKYEAATAAVLRALNADSRTRVGTRLDSIQVLDRDSAGRAERVALHGTADRVVRGEEFRDVLATAFGARSVRSTWFNIETRGHTFVFEGRGFGHGVGLCQAGALARVRAGEKLSAILQTYFPGTKIVAAGGD